MSIAQRGYTILILCLLMLTANSCITGNSTTLRTDWIEYPVSLSRSVIDAEGRFIEPAESDVVHHFSITQTDWSIGWGAKLVSRIQGNISEILKKEIEDHSGDAIVKLRIRASMSEGGAIFPLIPTRFQIVLEGDVVTLDNRNESSISSPAI